MTLPLHQTSAPAASHEAINQVEALPSHFSRIWTVSPTSRAKPWVTEPRKLQMTVERMREMGKDEILGRQRKWWQLQTLWHLSNMHAIQEKGYGMKDRRLNFWTATAYFHHWSKDVIKAHKYKVMPSSAFITACLSHDNRVTLDIRAWLSTSRPCCTRHCWCSYSSWLLQYTQ